MKIKGTKQKYQIDQNDCYWNMLLRTESGIRKLADDDIQNKRGVYIFWGLNDEPIRIGKAVKVRNRLLSYFTSHLNSYVWNVMHQEITMVSAIYTSDRESTALTELDLLSTYKPKYNYNEIKPYLDSF